MNRELVWAEIVEPFIEHLGVGAPEFSAGHGKVELRLERRHTNRFDMAHGGVIATLLDFVMAQACRSADEDQRPAITIEIKSTFVQPGRGTLRCTGHCVHRGRSLAFGEARVMDGQGSLVAFGSGTFKYARPQGKSQ
jgi:uncharacterized protein (TIGR00369 family)